MMENANKNFIYFSWVHLDQEMLGLEEVWEERGARFWKEHRDKTWGVKEAKPKESLFTFRSILIKN